jgi:aminoglycoside phosphotransferase (APT) family kinase protein
MATQRAAEMARIMMEEWPEGESAQSLALRLFFDDTFADLEQAIKIFAELEAADTASAETIKRRQM